MKILINKLQELGFFTAGILSHHYGSKLLDYNQERNDTNDQNARDNLLNSMNNKLETIMSNLNNSTLNNDQTNNLNQIVNEASQLSTRVRKSLDNNVINDEVKNDFNSMQDKIKDVQEYINNISKKGFDDLVPDFTNIYEYLDKLTLLQESSLLHIILFIVLLLTIIKILIILFANEIIEYFKLENKSYILNTILKIRSKFTKYSLIWNIIVLFIICIFAIGINILVLIVT